MSVWYSGVKWLAVREELRERADYGSILGGGREWGQTRGRWSIVYNEKSTD